MFKFSHNIEKNPTMIKKQHFNLNMTKFKHKN